MRNIECTYFHAESCIAANMISGRNYLLVTINFILKLAL